MHTTFVKIITTTILSMLCNCVKTFFILTDPYNKCNGKLIKYTSSYFDTSFKS